MKARIHRVAGSRSFIRSLSIVAVAVVAFAAVELLHVQPAHAGIVCCTNTLFNDCLCDSSLTCSITRNGKFYGRQVLGKTCWNYSSYGSASQIKSTIVCEAVNGIGTKEFTQSALLGTTVLDLTSFSQSALLSCEVRESSDPSHIDPDPHLCQLDISYSRTGLLAECTNHGGNPATSTLSYSAFCGDVSNKKNPLSVSGTLQCGDTLNPDDRPNWCGNNPDCVLNLGIADQQGKCDDLFPADAGRGLAEGQVLSFSQTVEGSFCDMESQVLTVNNAETRYCTGGTFDGAPVDCVSTVGQGRTQQQVLLSGPGGTTQSAVSFDVDFSPETLNATCNPNNNDLWRFLILGNQHLDVARIDVSSLKVEGQGAGSVTCGAVSNNNLSCAVKACPDVAAAVKAHTNGSGTADVTVTGRICEDLNDCPPGSGTAIIGEQTISISGR
jgi:hypothetical protein